MVAETTDSPRRETFGGLLRRHRVAAALSQEALAARAGLSTRAVSDLERGVKARPYLETVRLLAEALGLGLSEQAALAAAARPPKTAPTVSLVSVSAAVGAVAVGLPIPPTSLVGREREVAAVAALLREGGARLVTLTGPGGVGKTRLALAVARDVTAAFDAVVWVELAPLADPTIVPGAVARALAVPEETGRQPIETVRDALRTRHLLLVLDNCEHLRRATGDLAADLLGACPGLVVLATSRARLGVAAEHLYPVEPLALPAEGTSAPAAVAQSEAARLFVQRARAVAPDFSLTPANCADVAAVCRRLDGLPLAIELAAVRARVLSPAALRALLEERLRVLGHGPADAPDRHRTLRDAIAWSHDLLDGEQRTVFRRLAIFAGGCSLEAATVLCSFCDPFAALEGLEGLADQSLLVWGAGPDGEPRFGMLETVRAFALEQLVASGEAEAVRDAHAAFYLALAERAEPEMGGAGHGRWLDRLEVERANLRTALGRVLDRDPTGAGLRLAGALAGFWYHYGDLTEGRGWLERALAAAGTAAPQLRATVLRRAGELASVQGDYAGAMVSYEEALALSRTLRDEQGVASTLNDLGYVAYCRGEYARAAALYGGSPQKTEKIVRLERCPGLRGRTGRLRTWRLAVACSRPVVPRTGGPGTISRGVRLGCTPARRQRSMPTSVKIGPSLLFLDICSTTS